MKVGKVLWVVGRKLLQGSLLLGSLLTKWTKILAGLTPTALMHHLFPIGCIVRHVHCTLCSSNQAGLKRPKLALDDFRLLQLTR